MTDLIMKKIQALSFARRIALLPTIAGVGFVLIVAVSLTLGWRSVNRLELVEQGYAPSLEMSRDLDGILAEYQRTMQDAVAAEDEFSGVHQLRMTWETDRRQIA